SRSGMPQRPKPPAQICIPSKRRPSSAAAASGYCLFAMKGPPCRNVGRDLGAFDPSILIVRFLDYTYIMSINRVSLYHLETLLWIDRLGTFSAAAERLNTTQPTVSARMRELEQRLGTALFRREGRAMSLTAAGRKLVRD